jgi:hypothetical protein
MLDGWTFREGWPGALSSADDIDVLLGGPLQEPFLAVLAVVLLSFVMTLRTDLLPSVAGKALVPPTTISAAPTVRMTNSMMKSQDIQVRIWRPFVSRHEAAPRRQDDRSWAHSARGRARRAMPSFDLTRHPLLDRRLLARESSASSARGPPTQGVPQYVGAYARSGWHNSRQTQGTLLRPDRLVGIEGAVR